MLDEHTKGEKPCSVAYVPAAVGHTGRAMAAPLVQGGARLSHHSTWYRLCSPVRLPALLPLYFMPHAAPLVPPILHPSRHHFLQSGVLLLLLPHTRDSSRQGKIGLAFRLSRAGVKKALAQGWGNVPCICSNGDIHAVRSILALRQSLCVAHQRQSSCAAHQLFCSLATSYFCTIIVHLGAREHVHCGA